jgi:hypothetical protein
VTGVAPGEPLPTPAGFDAERRVVVIVRDGRGVLSERLAAAPGSSALQIVCEGLHEELEQLAADPGCASQGSVGVETLAADRHAAPALVSTIDPAVTAAPSVQRTACEIAAQEQALGRGQLFAFDVLCGAANERLGYARDVFTLAEVFEFREDLIAALAHLPSGQRHRERVLATLAWVQSVQDEQAGADWGRPIRGVLRRIDAFRAFLAARLPMLRLGLAMGPAVIVVLTGGGP